MFGDGLDLGSQATSVASIPADNTKACLAELRNLGYTAAVEVGFVQSNFDPETPIAIEI